MGIYGLGIYGVDAEPESVPGRWQEEVPAGDRSGRSGVDQKLNLSMLVLSKTYGSPRRTSPAAPTV